MKDGTDPRHMARIAVLQKLFERHFNLKDISQIDELEYDLADLEEINEQDFDLDLFGKLLEGTAKTYKQSDEIIQKLAPQWPIDMINKVDLQILRLAIYEGFISKMTPVKVVINEAIDLGKEFGGETSGKFINGVLGNLVERQDLTKDL